MTIHRGEAGTTKQKEATMWKIVNPLCVVALCVVAASASAAEANDAQPGPVYFDVARGSHPHDVANGRRLLCVALGQLHRPHRYRDRTVRGHRSTHQRAGRTPRVVRFTWTDLGQLLEHWTSRNV